LVSPGRGDARQAAGHAARPHADHRPEPPAGARTMRVLFCPIASHGFVHPAIAVAHALQRRGHTVAFATGQAFTQTLAQAAPERIPRGAGDGASFAIERWFDPMNVVMQVKHIEYALRRFAPDVIVSHPLALGPVIVRERTRVPVAMLGMAAHLWPVSTA